MTRPFAFSQLPWLGIAFLGLAACAPYQSGQVFDEAPYRLAGARDDDDGDRRFRCLDLRVQPTFGRGASWIPIQYSFGNHCHTAANIDFGAIRVRATLGEEEMPLPVYDPRGEIAPAQLDARRYASETIAYEIPQSWVGERLRVCVMVNDVAAHDFEHMPSFCFDWEST